MVEKCNYPDVNQEGSRSPVDSQLSIKESEVFVDGQRVGESLRLTSWEIIRKYEIAGTVHTQATVRPRSSSKTVKLRHGDEVSEPNVHRNVGTKTNAISTVVWRVRRLAGEGD